MTASYKPIRDAKSFDRASSALAKIAEELGCSVDDFRNNQSIRADSATLDELLMIWQTIHCPDARRRVVEFARQEAKQSAR